MQKPANFIKLTGSKLDHQNGNVVKLSIKGWILIDFNRYLVIWLLL